MHSTESANQMTAFVFVLLALPPALPATASGSLSTMLKLFWTGSLGATLCIAACFQTFPVLAGTAQLGSQSTARAAPEAK
jgi:hypothetical protein